MSILYILYGKIVIDFYTNFIKNVNKYINLVKGDEALCQ